ncbi:MAG: hypothetical protein QOC63_4603, partial [Mycobacterium sp.]|nr:hypothetical protein [Mycobacterium sp.]
ERLRATQTVTSWLGRDRGFAATTPLPGADLVEVDPTTTVTFWTYYPQPPESAGAPLTSAHLGQLLADLHHIGWPPTPLPRWTPLESLDRALSSTADNDAISTEERQWPHPRHPRRTSRTRLATRRRPNPRRCLGRQPSLGHQHQPAPGDPVRLGPGQLGTPRSRPDPRLARSRPLRPRRDVDPGLHHALQVRPPRLGRLPDPAGNARSSTATRPSALRLEPAPCRALRQRLGAIRAGDHTATWVAL